MEHIEVWVCAVVVLFLVGLLGMGAYDSHVKGEIVKAAIEAKVDPATMCMLTKR